MYFQYVSVAIFFFSAELLERFLKTHILMLETQEQKQKQEKMLRNTLICCFWTLATLQYLRGIRAAP